MFSKLRKIADRLKANLEPNKQPVEPQYIVYTSILGGYDDLPGLAQIDEALRYICFADTPEKFENTVPWEIVPVASFFQDRKLMNGYLKANPDILFGENCIATWVDGNLKSLMLSKIYLESVVGQSSVATPPHLIRTSVIDEINIVEEVGVETEHGVKTIRNLLVSEKYPDDMILSGTMLLVRDLRNAAVRQANRIWSGVILSGVRRDQLSFDFALWKAGLRPLHLELDWDAPNFLFNRVAHKNPVNRERDAYLSAPDGKPALDFPAMPDDYPSKISFVEESVSGPELSVYRSLNAIVEQTTANGVIEGNYCHFNDAMVREATPPDLRRSWKREFLRNAVQGSKSALEIGFNAGHSSAILLEREPGLSLTSIDIGIHKYTQPCADFITKHYTGRFSFMLGDSRELISKIDLAKFDFVHIDGGHGEDVFSKEIDWFCKSAKSGTKVLVDDAYVSYIWSHIKDNIANGNLEQWDCGFPSSGENLLFIKA